MVDSSRLLGRHPIRRAVISVRRVPCQDRDDPRHTPAYYFQPHSSPTVTLKAWDSPRGCKQMSPYPVRCWVGDVHVFRWLSNKNVETIWEGLKGPKWASQSLNQYQHPDS